MLLEYFVSQIRPNIHEIFVKPISNLVIIISNLSID